LYYDRPGSGLSSLYQRRLDHFGIALDKQETVIVDTIDGYCSRNDIDHIDLLKLDVEGHELAALLGASAMLSGGRIDFVSFDPAGQISTVEHSSRISMNSSMAMGFVSCELRPSAISIRSNDIRNFMSSSRSAITWQRGNDSERVVS
jgi:hypothetical protein